MSSVDVFDPNERCRPNVLCSLCAAVVSRSKLLHRGVGLAFARISKTDKEELYPGYSSLQELVNSSQTGCHLCSLLVHTVPGEDMTAFVSDNRSFGAMQVRIWQPRWIRRKDNPVMRLRQGSIQEHCLIALVSPEFNKLRIVRKFVGVVRTNSRKRSLATRSYDVSRVFYGPDPLSLRNPHDARLSSYTGSEAVYEMSRQSIQDCTSNHALCHREKWEQILPARLIHVGTAQPNDALRIVVSTSLDSAVDYTTLSYCWGGASPMVLRTDNVEHLMKRIDVDKLPKTVSDAITVTKGLGYRYLWVDSLCIIQNSKADWEAESVKMGQIYRNSVCTICASSADTVDVGFLTLRNPLLTLPCNISGTVSKGILAVANQDWFDKNTYYSGPINVTDGIKQCLRTSKLDSRAWVVQERLLSRRNLHFTSEGIMWECLTKEAFESNPTGTIMRNGIRWSISNILHLGKGYATKDYARLWSDTAFQEAQFSSEPLKIENKVLAEESRLPFLECWGEILSKYTRCEMTNRSDRLPGIIGIIKEIQNAIGFECLDGIWNIDHWVANQLVWHVAWNERDWHPRPKACRAPSWSWVSVDGTIVLPAAKRTITTYGLFNPRTTDVRCPGKRRIEVLEIAASRRATHNDVTSESPGGVLRISGKIIPKSKHDVESWYCKQDVFESMDIYPDQVFFLLVLDHNPGFHPSSRNTQDSAEVPEYEGLVLVKTHLTKNTYRRIGWFYAKNRDNWYKKTDDAEMCMELHAAFDACSPQTISII